MRAAKQAHDALAAPLPAGRATSLAPPPNVGCCACAIAACVGTSKAGCGRYPAGCLASDKHEQGLLMFVGSQASEGMHLWRGATQVVAPSFDGAASHGRDIACSALACCPSHPAHAHTGWHGGTGGWLVRTTWRSFLGGSRATRLQPTARAAVQRAQRQQSNTAGPNPCARYTCA